LKNIFAARHDGGHATAARNQQGIICTSPVSRVSSNLTDGDAIGYGGGGTGPARVKSNTVDWDDDWSE
jgi:hypothetical protein